jgi:hypothetical protein
MKTNYLRIIILLALTIIIAFLLTNFTESYSFLPIRQKDVSSLVNTLWQVHAGLATTSIAVLALIIGLNREEIYGFKVLDFMLNINRQPFKFHEEVIISILLIVIQYWFVSQNELSGALFCFFMSVVFLLRMLQCSITIILFEKDVEKRIEKYIQHKTIEAIKLENRILERNEE